jgi:hypothetical protein
MMEGPRGGRAEKNSLGEEELREEMAACWKTRKMESADCCKPILLFNSYIYFEFRLHVSQNTSRFHQGKFTDKMK